MEMEFLLMFLIGEVISATAQKSTVDAVVGSKNYSSFVFVPKTANLFGTLQGKDPVSVLHQPKNYSSL